MIFLAVSIIQFFASCANQFEDRKMPDRNMNKKLEPGIIIYMILEMRCRFVLCQQNIIFKFSERNYLDFDYTIYIRL